MFEWERAAWTEARTTTRFRMWRIDKGHGADVVDGTMTECLSALYGRDDLTIDYPAPGAEGEVIATVRLAVVESQVLSTPAVGNVAYRVLSGPQPPLMHSGKSHFDLPAHVYEAADDVIAEAEAITRAAAPATTAIEMDPETGRIGSASDRRWRAEGRVASWILGAGAAGYAVTWLGAPLIDSSDVILAVVAVGMTAWMLVAVVLMIASLPAAVFAVGAVIKAGIARTADQRREWLTRLAVFVAVIVAGRVIVPLATAALAVRRG